jgi:hypothetical protein
MNYDLVLRFILDVCSSQAQTSPEQTDWRLILLAMAVFALINITASSPHYSM